MGHERSEQGTHTEGAFRYALQNRAEFEAELISATLRGRTFSKELLSYSNLNAPEKMDELAGKLLGYASGKDLCTPSEDLRAEV